MAHESTDADFGIAVSTERAVNVVAVTGELDMASASAFATSTYAAAAAAKVGLIVDLSEVTFLSSSGITVLLRALDMLDSGSQLALVAPHPAVTRPIALSGLDRAVQSYSDRHAAIDSMVCS